MAADKLQIFPSVCSIMNTSKEMYAGVRTAPAVLSGAQQISMECRLMRTFKYFSKIYNVHLFLHHVDFLHYSHNSYRYNSKIVSIGSLQRRKLSGNNSFRGHAKWQEKNCHLSHLSMKKIKMKKVSK